MSDGTKADDLALALEEAIVSGELAPGTVLRQEQLSEQFEVSRTPIREALRKLAALGLVSFEPNRGVRVRTISREDLYEAFLVRAELESLATEIATPKMSVAELADLEAAERRFSDVTHQLVEMAHAGRQDLELARETLRRIEGLGISMERVTQELIDEGVASFGKSFDELIEAIESQRKALAPA